MAGMFGGGGFPGMAGAPQALQLAYLRDPRMALANQLQAMGGDTSPVQSHLQGVGRLAQALLGAYTRHSTAKEYEGQAKQYQDDMRALYAPVQEMQAGADGRPGPTNTATMTTRAPTLQDITGRIGNLQSPYALQEARRFQDMAMQQAAAAEAERNKPFNLRPGERRYGPGGVVLADNPVQQNNTPKIGDVRRIPQGNQEIAQEWTGQGWQQIGAGPRWQPQERGARPITAEERQIFGIPAEVPAYMGADGKPGVINLQRPEGEGRDFTQERNIRTEFTNASKPFEDLRQHWTRLNAAYQQKDGPGDIAMVYSFMKMLDPTSVVREGEFATAQNAGGVPDQILQLYNRALRGERLPDEVRAGFLQQGARQFDEIARTQVQTERRFRGLAQQYNLNPDRVVPDIFGNIPRPNLDQPFTWTPPAAPGQRPSAPPERSAPAAGARAATQSPQLPPGVPPLPPGFDLVAPR